MDEISATFEPIRAGNADPLTGFASHVVTALDQITDYLMTVYPVEGVGQEVPLTLSEVRAVKAISPIGSISMRQLANSLSVPMSTATHIVDRLVTKRIVVRIRPEYDRRLVLVELSQNAKKHWQVTFHKRVELTRQILEPLSPAARDQVVRVFGEIAEAASSKERPAPEKPENAANGLSVSGPPSDSQAGKRS